MNQTARDLLYLIRTLSVRHEPHQRPNGTFSSIEVDLDKTLSDPDGLRLTGRLLVDLWIEKGWEVDALACSSPRATVLACAMTYEAHLRGKLLPFYLVSDQLSPLTEHVEEGTRLLILEKSSLTGDNLLRTIHFLQEQGLNPVQVVCLLDQRVGDARDSRAEAGIKTHFVFNLTELVP